MVAEVAVERRDWKRVETELENLIPKVSAPSDELSIRPSCAPPRAGDGSDVPQAVLDQIAKALEDDKVGLPID
jgi:hypothetical protein